MSLYQWIGPNNGDLGTGGNWVDTTDPGMGQPPGPGDVAIIQTGEGLQGTLNVGGLDLVQAAGAPTLSITGSSTQVTAASVAIAYGVTLDTGAFLEAGTLAIDGSNTLVTVETGALLYVAAGQNDVLSIGASSGNATVLITKGGVLGYNSLGATGTLSLGDASGSTATLTISGQGYFESTLSSVEIGAVAGATGILNVVGAGSEVEYDNYGNTTIGDYGELGGSAQGTVSVINGGFASLSSDGEVDIGTTGGMAKVLVSGANSAVQAGPFVQIGVAQSNIAGEIIVQTGGEFDTFTDALLNNGTIAVAGAGSLFTARTLDADGGTVVQIASGGLIHVTDIGLGGTMRLIGGSVNVRAGLYMYSGSVAIGSGTIAATTITNTGRLVASGGTLVVNGSVVGTGADQIQSGAMLELNGTVAAGQTIAFESGANRLALGDAAGVAAQIIDFATGDAIDLLGKAVTKLSYASGALTAFNGATKVATLEIKGGYSAANFKLASDGHAGSLISYAATSGSAGPQPIGGPLSFVPSIMHQL